MSPKDKQDTDIFSYLQKINKLMAAGMVATQIFNIALPIARASYTGSSFYGLSPVRKYFNEQLALAVEGENELPYTVSKNPFGSGVAVNSKFTLEFNEPMHVNSGSMRIRRASDDSIAEEVSAAGGNPAGGGSITVSGHYVIFDPTVILSAGQSYYIEIDGELLYDAQGNMFSGINNSWAPWSFTTSDLPHAAAVSPQGSGTDLTQPELMLTMSKEVELGTGNLELHRLDNDAVVWSAAFSGGVPVSSGNGVYQVSGEILRLAGLPQLEQLTPYYITVSSGLLLDLSGHAFEGFTDNQTWEFSVRDVEPLVVSKTPQDSGVALDSVFTVEFNEPMRLASGSMYIRRSADDSIAAEIVALSGGVVTGGTITTSGSYVTFDPSVSLSGGVDYYMELPWWLLLDEQGNMTSGIGGGSTQTWSFRTVGSVSSPYLSNVWPTDSGSSIRGPGGVNMGLSLSEPVRLGTGTIEIHRVDNDEVVWSMTFSGGERVSAADSYYSFSGGMDSGNGTDFYISHTPQIPEETLYYVTVSSGMFIDLSGEAFTGIADKSTWRFSTLDTEPWVSATIPENNGAIFSNRSITVEFSEAMHVASGVMRIRRAADNSIEAKIQAMSGMVITGGTVTTSGSYVTFDPDVVLSGRGMNYYVEVEPWMLLDEQGNPFSGIGGDSSVIWNFSASEPTQPPHALSVWPTGSGVSVQGSGANLGLYLDKVVLLGTGEMRIHRADTDEVVWNIVFDHGVRVPAKSGGNYLFSGAGASADYGNVFYITDLLPLSQETLYYVTISSGMLIGDSGLVYTGISDKHTWEFTTRDLVPQILGTTPNDSGVALDATFTVEFSEPMHLASGSMRIRRSADDSVAAEIASLSGGVVTGGTITTSGSYVTFDPDVTLSGGVDYYVEMLSGLLLDEQGNLASGIGGGPDRTWNFRTLGEADELPYVIIYSPFGNGVELDSTFGVTFSEPMHVASGAMRIHRVLDDSVALEITASGGIATGGGTIKPSGEFVTFYPSGTLSGSTDFYVELEPSMLLDEQGNLTSGIGGGGAQTWSFRTVDAPPPLPSRPHEIGMLPIGSGSQVYGPGTYLALYMDKPVKMWTGRFEIHREDNDQVVWSMRFEEGERWPGESVGTYLLSGGTNSQNGTELYVMDLPFLAENTLYYVTVQSGTLLGIESGGLNVGITDKTTWKFKTRDNQPQVTATAPQDSGVALDATFTVEFSEPMHLASGSMYIRRSADDSIAAEIAALSGGVVTGGTITTSGSYVTFDPDVTLSGGVNYYVQMPAWLLLDEQGNMTSGIGSGTPWNWKFRTVEQPQPPYMTFMWPEGSGAYAEWGGPRLGIEMSEPFTLGTGAIEVHRSDNDALLWTIAFSGGQPIPGMSGSYWLSGGFTSPERELLLVEDMPLFPQTLPVYMTISSGLFVDASGLTYSGIADKNTWKFSTKDEKPLVVATAPQDSGVALDATFTVEFSEPMHLASGSMYIRRSADDSIAAEIAALSGGVVTGGTITTSGSYVTFDPDVTLSGGVNYYVQMPAWLLLDEQGNMTSGIGSGTPWNWRFRTIEPPQPPYMTFMWPEGSGAYAEWGGPRLGIEMSEPFTLGTGAIEVHRSDNDALLWTLAFSGGQPVPGMSGSYWLSGGFTSPERELLLVEDMPLFPQTLPVYVTISSGLFVDASGLTFSGIADKNAWKFSTKDEKPLVVATAPQDSGVALDATFTVEFSEPMHLASGSMYIRRSADDSIAAEITALSGGVVTGGTITTSGSYVMFDPEDMLSGGVNYYVQMPAWLLLDEQGNMTSGIGSGTPWNWGFRTVEQPQPPYMTFMWPEGSGAYAEWGGPRLGIEMSEPFTLGTGAIEVHRSDNDALLWTLAFSGGEPVPGMSGSYWFSGGFTSPERELLLVEDMPLFPQTLPVYVTISSGLFVDASGLTFSGIADKNAWKFSAKDEKPLVVTTTPQDSGVSLDATFTVEFSEPMHLASGSMYIRRSADDSIAAEITALSGGVVTGGTITTSGSYVMFDPEDMLSGGVNYYLEVPAWLLLDEQGNVTSGIGFGSTRTWSFRTVEVPQPPYMTERWPQGSGVEIKPGRFVGLQLSEPFTLGTGSFDIHFADSDAIVWSMAFSKGELVPGTSGSYLLSGGTAPGQGIEWYAFDLPSLPQVTPYYVTISSGLMIDLSGQSFSGITDPNVWKFTTLDEVPTIIGTSPQNSGVSVNAVFTMEFSEAMHVTSGAMRIRRSSDDSIAAEIAALSGGVITGGTITTSGSYVTFDPSATLVGGVDYYVEVPSWLLLDEQGNPASGVGGSGQGTWSFRTAAPVPPPSSGGSSGNTDSSSTQEPSNEQLPSPVTEPAKPESTPPAIQPAQGTKLLTKEPVRVQSTVASFTIEPEQTVTASTLTYYYDEDYQAWIAAPTIVQDGKLVAQVPEGSWTTVMDNPQIAQPPDTQTSWANTHILKLISLGVIEGFEDGSYQPQAASDRYQAAVLMAKAAKLDTSSVDVSVLDTLPDQTSIPQWARPYVAAVLQQGLMNGQDAGFGGETALTRAEMATLIGRMLPQTEADSTASYADGSDIPDWAQIGVAQAYAYGIMDGFPDATFRPDEPVTREQMAAILSRLMDRLAKKA